MSGAAVCVVGIARSVSAIAMSERLFRPFLVAVICPAFAIAGRSVAIGPIDALTVLACFASSAAFLIAGNRQAVATWLAIGNTIRVIYAIYTMAWVLAVSALVTIASLLIGMWRHRSRAPCRTPSVAI